MKEQIERIRTKFNQLKQLDKNFETFGSEKHKYLFNSTKSEKELTEFEIRNKINLPIEYKEFLMKIGNGGAGPYYGLEPIENGLFADLDYKDKNDLNDLSEPFPHSEHWNLDFGEVTDENEDEYFQNKWANGLLRVSNFGCGVSMNLVVNGKEYGNLWVDDRCNDQGIYPNPYIENRERITFLDWYENWIDSELKEKTTGNTVYN
ncbi:SMI1/KNR4 family protein [Winogradskyella sp. PAMC22761]|nr:SMI1/KNR4 family protein [Winogradskyella sp. PAMC22761]